MKINKAPAIWLFLCVSAIALFSQPQVSGTFSLEWERAPVQTSSIETTLVLQVGLTENEIDTFEVYLNGILYLSTQSRGLQRVSSANDRTLKSIQLNLAPGVNNIEVIVKSNGVERNITHQIQSTFISWDFSESYPPELVAMSAEELYDYSTIIPSGAYKNGIIAFLMEYHPHTIWGRFYLASALTDQGNYRDAREIYDGILTEEPEFARVHNNIAYCSFFLNDINRVFNSYEQILSFEPSYWDYRSIMTQHHYINQEIGPQRAEEFLSHWSRRLGEFHPIICEIKGEAALKQRNYERALRWFEKATESTDCYYRIYEKILNLKLDHLSINRSVEYKTEALRDFIQVVNQWPDMKYQYYGYIKISQLVNQIYSDDATAFDYARLAYDVYPCGEALMDMIRFGNQLRPTQLDLYVDTATRSIPYDAEALSAIAWYYSEFLSNPELAVEYQVKAIQNSHSSERRREELYSLMNIYEDVLLDFDTAKQLPFMLDDCSNEKVELYKALSNNRFYSGDMEEALVYLNLYRNALGEEDLYYNLKNNQASSILALQETDRSQEIVISMRAPSDEMALSPVENIAAIGTSPLELWDLDLGIKIRDLGPGSGPDGGGYNNVAFSPDGQYIATIDEPDYEGRDSVLFIYRRSDGYPVVSMPFRIPLNSLAWNPNSDRIALHDHRGNVQIVDVETHKRIETFRSGATRIGGPICWMPNDLIAVGQAQSNHITVWNNEFELLKQLNGISWPHALGSSYDGRYLICSDNQGTISVWDSLNWSLRQMRNQPFSSKNINSHPSEHSVLMDNFSSSRRSIQYGMNQLNLLSMEIEYNYAAPSYYRSMYSFDGQSIRASSGYGIHQYDVQTFEHIGTFEGFADPALGMAIDMKNNYLLTTSDDGTAFWDLYSGNMVHHENILITGRNYEQNTQGMGIQIEQGRFIYVEGKEVYVYDVESFSSRKIITLDESPDRVVMSENYILFTGWKENDMGNRGSANSENGITHFQLYDRETLRQITDFEAPIATEYAHYGVHSPWVHSMVIDEENRAIHFTTTWRDGWGTSRLYSSQVISYSLSGNRLETRNLNHQIKALEINPSGSLIARTDYHRFEYTDGSWDYLRPGIDHELILQDGRTLYWNTDKVSLGDKNISLSQSITQVSVDMAKNLLILQFSNGILSFYNLTSMEEQLSLAAKDSNQWIAISQSGDFASSPRGTDGVTWNIQGELLPVESLSQSLESHQLVQRQLEAIYSDSTEKLLREFELPVSIDELYKSYHFEITSQDSEPDRQGRQNLRIALERLGISSVNPEFKIFVNNRLFHTLEVPSASPSFQNELRLFPGYNEIRVEMYIHDIKIQSETFTSFNRTYDQKPNLYFIGVGVSQYRNRNQNLNYPHRDVEAINQALEEQEGYLYDQVISRTLINQQATSENLSRVLEEVQLVAEEEDIIFIFMAGHGIQSQDQSLYFITHEADMSSPETGYPLSEMQSILQERPLLQRVVLALDICHSGASLPQGDGDRLIDSSQSAYNLTRDMGITFLTSSTGRQFSYESSEYRGGHGAFSAAIIDILEGAGDDDLDNRISLIELEEEITDRVVEYTHGKQVPMSNASINPDYEIFQLTQ